MISFQFQRIQSYLYERSKAVAERKRDSKVLPKLKEKEEKLIQKVSMVSGNPQNYLDPENKIKDLELQLQKIRKQIQAEIVRRNHLDTSSNLDKQPSLEDNENKN